MDHEVALPLRALRQVGGTGGTGGTDVFVTVDSRIRRVKKRLRRFPATL
jgi:hypothetical protein